MEEEVLAMAEVLLAAVLLILHDNHKNFVDPKTWDQIKGSMIVMKYNMGKGGQNEG